MSNEEVYFDADPVLLGDLVEKNNLLSKYGNIDTLCLILKTDISNGLASDPMLILKHEHFFGRNFIPPKISKKLYEYIVEPLKDPMTLAILIGGILLFIIEMVRNPSSGGADGISIIIVVIIIVSITAFTDYKKEKQLTNLQKSIKTSNTCTAIRGGIIVEIKTIELVVGDIYMPKYGDMVPADGVVVVSNDLKIEESAITGETGLIKKDPINRPYLLAGTHVMDGSGKVLIVAVGYNSQTGRILRLMGALKAENSKKDKSDDQPEEINHKSRNVLQEKLNKLVFYLGIIGVLAGIIVAIIYLVRFCITTYTGASARSFKLGDLQEYLEFAIEGICVIVVAVPEGLPLAITLSLAYSVSRMMKDKNLVRDLHSCETMGNATTICSDKTGTLTTNRMTVVEVYLADKHIDDFANLKPFHAELKDSICMNICINKNQSSFLEPPKQSGGLPSQMGNKTDCALLGFLSHFETDYDAIMTRYPGDKIVKTFPFNSEKKLMSSIVDIGNNKYRILVKGAPDVLLRLCNSYINADGIIQQLSSTSLNQIQNILLEMSQHSLRTILLAQKDFDKIEISDDISELSIISDLVLVCLTGIEDPVRPDVPEAIKSCFRAGIVVRMVTGDNIVTARAIASKCGIIGRTDDEIIIDSTTFNKSIVDETGKFSQLYFDKVWPNLRVLARATPTDKYVLVNGILNTELKEKQIVAVTGDGTNDAPALKRADVGFAMGITGTDIAKEASDIIITDDNFASIVKAVLWGRNVYDSISKFIQFQLTVNFATVILSVFSSAYGGSKFFTPAQLLWLNIIMDTFASLALATSKPKKSLLYRKPYSRDKGLLSKNMTIFIIFHGIYQVAIILLIVFLGDKMFQIKNEIAIPMNDTSNKVPTVHGTMVFNTFSLMQIFNEINARVIHNERNVFTQFFKNKLFIIIMFVSLVIQVTVVCVGGKFFFVKMLSIGQWGWCLLFGCSVLIYHQLVVCNMSLLISIPKRFRITKGFDSKSITINNSIDARLLWVRGIKKLQQELRIIEAFKQGLVVRRELTVEHKMSKTYIPPVVIIENEAKYF